MSENYKESELIIRQAKKEDMTAVADMIQELADFEKMSDGPKISVKELEHDGFERHPPAFQCKVAEVEMDKVRTVVGYALYFPTYSTWEGRALMLEDLYVRSAQRRRGVGARLFHEVAKNHLGNWSSGEGVASTHVNVLGLIFQEAVASGCNRLDFHVLEWNPASAFYARAGATDLSAADSWHYWRLAGAALRHFAESHAG